MKTGAPSHSVASEEMARHYEQLRRQALGQQGTSRNLGLALFLRRGMAAWMQAWVECAPARDLSGAGPSRGEPDLSADVRGELIRGWVDMALSARREG